MMSERNERDLIDAINRIGSALYALGNGDAYSGGVGAIENLAMMVRDGFQLLSENMGSHHE